MIDIQIDTGQIKATGHAKYAPYGQDIVCSAFSMLVQTFIKTLETEQTPIKYKIAPGDIQINYEDQNKDTKAHVRSFLVGVELLEEAYPKNIKLTKH